MQIWTELRHYLPVLISILPLVSKVQPPTLMIAGCASHYKRHFERSAQFLEPLEQPSRLCGGLHLARQRMHLLTTDVWQLVIQKSLQVDFRLCRSSYFPDVSMAACMPASLRQ